MKETQAGALTCGYTNRAAAHIGHCQVQRLENETGEAVLTRYQVFPGIELIYNDVHLGRYDAPAMEQGDVIEIEHCREGRVECRYRDAFYYLTSGDLAISRRDAAGHQVCFPLNHYHGITIRIDLNRAPACLSCFLEDINVQPTLLMEKFCGSGRCFVARSKPSLLHIFSELYAVPDSIKRGYFKVKILELLLFLTGMDIGEDECAQRSVARSQAALAKRVCTYLTDHMESHVTIAELAERFHVSQTTLKNSFKGVYGLSVYSYIREQKMQRAALLLRGTEQSVLEIAGKCGYENASKFASAFRDVMGLTPREYRNSLDDPENED